MSTDDFSRFDGGDLGPTWSLERTTEDRSPLPAYICLVIDGVAKLYKGDQLIQETKINFAPGDSVTLEFCGAQLFLNGEEVKPR